MYTLIIVPREGMLHAYLKTEIYTPKLKVKRHLPVVFSSFTALKIFAREHSSLVYDTIVIEKSTGRILLTKHLLDL